MTNILTKAVFNMEPFTCPSCVKQIENTLGKVDGVEQVQVMFNSNRVRVQFNEDLTNIDALQKTVERLGYPVISKKTS